MKLIILIFYFFLSITSVFADKINFEALEISSLKNGNQIVGKGNAKTVINGKIFIKSDEMIYDKENKILEAKGNIEILDQKNNLIITSNFLKYEKFKETIVASENVIVREKENDIKIYSNHIVYSIKQDEIFSKNKTRINIGEIYKVRTSDLKFKNKDKFLLSNKKTFINDNDNNKIELDKFFYSHLENKIVGKNIQILDFLENNYFVTDGFINVKEKKLLGKNIRINLKKDTFGNSENNPRLKGNSVIYGGNKTMIQKGVFTSCKMNKDCSPWHITSKEIIHYKNKEEIHYKNAWLHIYDKPVFYFPKFFHPDPSVKRRSGFLTPRINNNNNLGSSLTLPYFSALSESSDYTITPRIFSHKEFLLQNEYRKVTKNSSHNFDFSINKNENDNKNGRKTHFFSNSSIKNLNSYFDESSINLNIEKVSNDNYIKEYNLESSSPILKDTEILESNLEFSALKDDFNLDVSFQSYETMNKTNNDRYEFVYPNYSLSKLVSLNNIFFENIDFRSSGSQKKFATNIYEGVQINDVLLSSNNFNSSFGITHNFKTVFKNINSEGKKSSKYKNEFQSEILNLSSYDLSLPLIKKDGNISDYLTPKLSFRHSPNDTKNIRNNATLLNSGNVFSFNRIGQNDNIEGGSSLTIGLDYEKKNKNNNTTDTIFKHRLATVFRNNLDENLPTKSTLGKKQSDFIGEAIFNPNDIFSLNYNYLLDKNVNNINLHNLTNKIRVNNFVGNFTFYEENNLVGKESYYESSIGYTIDNNNLIKFSTRENKKDNLTEFYDLIYEYKNDCLTASIKYNKKYYTNSYLKPSEDLFFTITIIPLGSTQTESVLD